MMSLADLYIAQSDLDSALFTMLRMLTLTTDQSSSFVDAYIIIR